MKRIDITGTTEIDVKRFHLPIIIQVKCKKCNTINDHDLSSNYLSYPIINKPESIDVYCKSCEEFFSTNVILKIAIEVED